MNNKTHSVKNALSLPSIFLVYFLVLFVWTWYRNVTRFPEIVDDLLAKPLIWIMPVFVVLYWKKISLGTVSFRKITIRLVFISIFSGIGLALLQIIPNVIKGNEQVHVPSDLGILPDFPRL